MLKPISYDAGPEIGCNGWIFYDENNNLLPILPEDIRSYEIKFTGSKWVVVDGRNFILNKIDNNFVYNTMPSERPDDWRTKVHFDSPEEAYEFLQKWKTIKLAEIRKNKSFKLWPQQ